MFTFNLIYWVIFNPKKAISNDKIDVVKLLINSGASVNLKNNDGETALDIGMFNSLVISINLYNICYLARDYRLNEVANILIAAGGIAYVYL